MPSEPDSEGPGPDASIGLAFFAKRVRVFQAASFAACLAALAIHLAAYNGLRTDPRALWPLHLGVFVAWFPALLLLRLESAPGAPSLRELCWAPRLLTLNLATLLLLLYTAAQFGLFLGAYRGSARGFENSGPLLRIFSAYWGLSYLLAFRVLGVHGDRLAAAPQA